MQSAQLRGAKTATTSGRSQAAFLSGTVLPTGRRAPQTVRRASASAGRLVVLAAATSAAAAATEETERLRLNNLAPQPGARRKNMRKGRGYAAGKGGSCGFGMRGQNSRSGPKTRAGFEGGQMPLYRRVPKLRGIAGGMSAGLPKFVTINLGQLKSFKEQEEVSLEALQEKRILNVSGREGKLPLKVLGDGELAVALTIKAASFSGSARAKIEEAGGTAIELPGKVKWTRKLGKQRAAEKAAASAPAAAGSGAKAE